MEYLPTDLYTAALTRQLDQLAIHDFNIPGYDLMSRAGEAIFRLLQDQYSLSKRILVCCGAGNNAGDGYVVARLAQQAGFRVRVISMVDTTELKGDARTAYEHWKSLGRQLSKCEPESFEGVDVIIDALLGTGLQRPVEGRWQACIELINGSARPVIAVDIPSGLNADTGSVMGIAVKAAMTLSFIGLKRGLFTHQAADYCGELFFDGLGVPRAVYNRVATNAYRLDYENLSQQLKPRRANTHKGSYGHVLVIGGDYGMAGAVRLAAEAALRAGAGLVTVVTRAEHVAAIVTGRPELMVIASEHGAISSQLLEHASSILIGPGLGTDKWGQALLSRVLESRCPKVLDADALNLLGQQEAPGQDWILTPHPGEAARLLGETTPVIQQSRFTAAEMLQALYGGVLVLKGAGTLVQTSHRVSVCPYGNPGLATAGSGDVLGGIIAALLAQGFDLATAAELGVVVHARAGDLAASHGERGLIASDLFDSIRHLINPDTRPLAQ